MSVVVNASTAMVVDIVIAIVVAMILMMLRIVSLSITVFIFFSILTFVASFVAISSVVAAISGRVQMEACRSLDVVRLFLDSFLKFLFESLEISLGLLFRFLSSDFVHRSLRQKKSC